MSSKYIINEAAKCLLCYKAPCQEACPRDNKVEQFLRSVRFKNFLGAKEILPNCLNCKKLDNKYPCEKACINDLGSLSISKIIEYINTNVSISKPQKVDLAINFLGAACENPFFLSSSVVASNYQMVAKAFELGWGGAVWKTIGNFLPQEVSPRFDTLEKEGTPFIGFRNLEQISDHPLEENLQFIRDLKKDYPTKVIIASIMGRNQTEWTYLAEQCEKAGADLIECNFSCPQMTGEGMGSDVGQNPELVESYCQATRQGTKLPILAKMTPNLADITLPAIAAIRGGADGIAAINTLKSLTGIDFANKQVKLAVNGKTAVSGYSGKAIKPLALRFIHDLKSCTQLKGIALSGIGGIETYQDALEFIMLGCGNIQITTAVMQYGYRIIEDLISGTKYFMQTNGYSSMSEIVGLMDEQVISADDLDRQTFCLPKFDLAKCLGCGRCYISCFDGGHQAIKFSEDRKPHLLGKNCVGCHLCVHICPTGAISPGKRVIKP